MSKRLVVIFEPELLSRAGAKELLVDLGGDFQNSTVASPRSREEVIEDLGTVNFLDIHRGAYGQDWPSLLSEITTRYGHCRPLLVAETTAALEAGAQQEMATIDASLLAIDEISNEIYDFRGIPSNSERELLRRYAADNR